MSQGPLNNQHENIVFGDAQIHSQSDTAAHSAALNIAINAEKTVDAAFYIRSIDENDTPRQYHFGNLPMQPGNHNAIASIAPGNYRVESPTVIQNGVIYYVDTASQQLRVDNDAR